MSCVNSWLELGEQLKWLQREGCYPCIYLRGTKWRAHVNAAGNYWADADTPSKALEEAVKLWHSKGRPMDGYGVET